MEEGCGMSDDNKQQRKEKMVEECLDAYAKLVAAFASHLRAGTEAKDVVETVDDMPPGMAKSILLARIGADAHHALGFLEQAQDRAATDAFRGLGDSPTLN